MKVTMMKGLPGSGKSTLAKAQVVSTGNSGRINPTAHCLAPICYCIDFRESA